MTKRTLPADSSQLLKVKRPLRQQGLKDAQSKPSGHPYGIQPLGNYFTNLSAQKPCRDVGLGPYMSRLSDLLVLELLGHLGARDLCRLAQVSRALYVFCNTDDLWKALVLDRVGGNFAFKGSWKATLQCLSGADADVPQSKPIRVQGFYSDLLFQVVVVRNIAWRESGLACCR